MLGFRFLVIIGTVLFFVVMVGYFFYGLQQNSALASSVEFRIAKGDGFKVIAAHLSQQSLIKSISVFKLYALLTGKAQKFQPGVYELAGTMSVPQIVDTLITGGKNDTAITIPEGYTVKDIESTLVAEGVLKSGELLALTPRAFDVRYPFLMNMKSFEGFLFPDTYRFNFNATPESVVERFLDNFNAKAWPLLSSNKNWYSSLILSSLLEREVPGMNDREIVAGILLKRMKMGMPLQVDATVIYAKCAGAIKDCKNTTLSRQDLSITSPYNTYQHLGLPPMPITNPGATAIQAALSPQSSPYSYYLSSPKTKATIFSKTLEEHNANKAKYL